MYTNSTHWDGGSLKIGKKLIAFYLLKAVASILAGRQDQGQGYTSIDEGSLNYKLVRLFYCPMVLDC